MKSLKKTFAVLAASALLGTTNFACAGIIGDSVNVTHYYPNLGSVNYDMGTQVVPTGNFNYFGVYDVVVFDNYMTYDSHYYGASFASATFNGPVITDLNTTFTSVAIDPSSTYSGLDNSRLSFDANHIYLNLNGLSTNGHFRINFADNASSNVPEPTSIALIGLGLLGVATMRRKSAK